MAASFTRVRSELAYVPLDVVERVLRDPAPPSAPSNRAAAGAVLSVRVRVRARRYEPIAAVFSATLSALVDEFGGDVVHVSHDALVVFWDQARTNEALEALGARALLAAQRLVALATERRFADAGDAPHSGGGSAPSATSAAAAPGDDGVSMASATSSESGGAAARRALDDGGGAAAAASTLAGGGIGGNGGGHGGHGGGEALLGDGGDEPALRVPASLFAPSLGSPARDDDDALPTASGSGGGGGGGPAFAVACGVAIGGAQALCVGGINGQWQHFVAGAPLMRASLCALAGASGAVVCDADDWHRLAPHARGLRASPLKADARAPVREGLVQLNGMLHAPRSRPIRITAPSSGLDGRLQRRLDLLDEIEQALYCFLPAPLVARLRGLGDVGSDSLWLTGMRTVSVLTVRLTALRFDDAHGNEVHSIACLVQSLANHYGGHVMAFYAVAKYTRVTVVFGLPPVVVEKLPLVAVNLALELLHALHRGATYVDARVGVATGRLVAGTVGGAHRRAYMLLGGVVSDSELLAAEADSGAVLVDDATSTALRGDAQRYAQRPGALPRSFVVSRHRDAVSQRPATTVAANAAALDDVSAAAHAHELDALLDEASLFLASGTARLVMVEGEIGFGKRRLLRVYERALQNSEFQRADDELLVLSSNADPIEHNTPFSVWRGVFAQLFAFLFDVDNVADEVPFDDALANVPTLADVYRYEPLQVLRVVFSVLPFEPPATLRAAVAHNLVGESAHGRSGGPSTPSAADNGVYGAAMRVLASLLIEAAPNASKIVILGSGTCMDRLSWSLVQYLQTAASSVMLVIFTRPPEAMSDVAQAQVAVRSSSDTLLLRLTPWSDEHVTEMVCAVLGVDGLAPSINQFVCERAQGNPFYASEVALALLESGRIVVRQSTGAESTELVFAARSKRGALASDTPRSSSGGSCAPAAAPLAPSLVSSAATALGSRSTARSSSSATGTRLPSPRHILLPAAGDERLDDRVPFPATIQGVVQKRVDQLTDAQQLVLRVAAVIGDVFEVRLLLDIMPLKLGIDARRELEELVAMHFFEPAGDVDRHRLQRYHAPDRSERIVLNDGSVATVHGDRVMFAASESSFSSASDDEFYYDEKANVRTTSATRSDSASMSDEAHGGDTTDSLGRVASAVSRSRRSSGMARAVTPDEPINQRMPRLHMVNSDERAPVDAGGDGVHAGNAPGWHRSASFDSGVTGEDDSRSDSSSYEYTYSSSGSSPRSGTRGAPALESADDAPRLRTFSASRMSRLRANSNTSGGSGSATASCDDEHAEAADENDADGAAAAAAAAPHSEGSDRAKRVDRHMRRQARRRHRDAARDDGDVHAPGAELPSATSLDTELDTALPARRRRVRRRRKRKTAATSSIRAAMTPTSKLAQATDYHNTSSSQDVIDRSGAGSGGGSAASSSTAHARTQSTSPFRERGFNVAASDGEAAGIGGGSHSQTESDALVRRRSQPSHERHRSGASPHSPGARSAASHLSGSLEPPPPHGKTDMRKSQTSQQWGSWRQETPSQSFLRSGMSSARSVSPAQDSFGGSQSTSMANSLPRGADASAHRRRPFLHDTVSLDQAAVLGDAALPALLQFAQPTLRQSVYGMILPSQRRQLHEAVAVWYEEHYKDNLEQYSALLAHHWSSAERARGDGDAEPTRLASKAIYYLERAAEYATQSMMLESARELYMQLLRLVRERGGRADLGKVCCWAMKLGLIEAKLGHVFDMRESLELCITMAGYQLPSAGAFKKLYERIVPARLRSAAPESSDRLVLLSVAQAYRTLAYVHLTETQHAVALDSAQRAVQICERVNDVLLRVDCNAMLMVALGCNGNVSQLQAARVRHNTWLRQLNRTPVIVSVLDTDPVTTLERARITTSSSLLYLGLAESTLRDISFIATSLRLRSTPKAASIFAVALYLNGQLSDAAVFFERALLTNPSDRQMRRWCYLRASLITVLGCPDVAHSLLEQDRVTDPVLANLDESLAAAAANGGKPPAPTRPLIGVEQAYYYTHASFVALALEQWDRCAALLRCFVALPPMGIGGMHLVMSMITAGTSAIDLARAMAAGERGATIDAPSALALAEQVTKRLRSTLGVLPVARGWIALFDGYLAHLSGKYKSAIRSWTDAISMARCNVAVEPLFVVRHEGSATAVSERSGGDGDDEEGDYAELASSGAASGAPRPSSSGALDRMTSSASMLSSVSSDDDSDLHSSRSHETLSYAVRRSHSLRTASDAVFRSGKAVNERAMPPLLRRGTRPHMSTSMHRHSTEALLDNSTHTHLAGGLSRAQVRRESSEASLSGVSEFLSDDSSVSGSAGSGAAREQALRGSGAGERQPLLLARAMDAIGRHLRANKRVNETRVLRKRITYLRSAARIFEEIGAEPEMHSSEVALQLALERQEAPRELDAKAASFWFSRNTSLNSTT